MQLQNFDFHSFRSAGETFLTNLVQELEDRGLAVHSLVSDHLCFRVKSISEYELFKQALIGEATLLTEAMVNGRPICTFRLNSTFKTKFHEVWLIELPAPKAGANYETGFEHAEFVINESFQMLVQRHPQCEFVFSGSTILNPELCLKLSSGQAKFHYQSLERVIEIEEAKIEDIIFDFDGTLIQSRETIYEINRRLFSEVLQREVTLEESKKNYHAEFSKMFAAFEISCPMRQTEAIAGWGRIAMQFEHSLFDGILPLLASLRGLGFHLHLWTARDEASAFHILEECGIETFFASFSFASPSASKPSAENLKFDWQESRKNSVLMIGDSPADMIGAKNIGAFAAAALWDPFVDLNALVSCGAELFFQSPTGLVDWLKLKTPVR